jgi:4-amino-4-deoxy-L-arabinose transferase-like glycosyltransferase
MKLTTPKEVAGREPLGSVRDSPRPFLAWLGVIASGGLAWRFVNVLVVHPTSSKVKPGGFLLWGDAWYYHIQAQGLAAGKGYLDPEPWVFGGRVEPGTQHPPAFTTFLALLDKLGLTSITAQRLACCVLGALTIVVIGWVTRDLAGNRAGFIAAALAAVYPQLWINDGMLLSESADALVIALVLLTAYRFWRNPCGRTAAVLGLTLGLATLTRAEALLLFPLLLLPLILTIWSLALRRRLQLLLAAGVVGAVALAPWVGYNLARFEKPTTISNGFGSAISAGNCDEVWYGSRIGLDTNCYPKAVPGADESAREAYVRKIALDYMGDHLRRLPLVVAARVGREWDVFKPFQNTRESIYTEGRGRLASWAGLWMYYALVPLAGIGLVLLRRRGIPISPMVSLAFIVTSAAAITFGLTRYRVPVEVALVILAGVTLDAAWSGRGARRLLRPRRRATRRGTSQAVP